MLIERRICAKGQAKSVTQLRETCLGCTDCTGPCHMLIQLSALPEAVLNTSEVRP